MDDVCESENLLLAYLINEDGSLSPLIGVESIFLTNSTVEICDLTSLLKSDDEDFVELAKEKILSDIQFRGAISDFHPIKTKIQNSDYDPLLIKSNEEDRYGDGNNFEVALTREAAECWIEVRDRSRDEKAKIEAERNAKELLEKTPRFKRKRIVKPWISLGSEAEIEDETKCTTKPVLTFQKRGRDFNQNLDLVKIVSEKLWSPNDMECWPFEDEENCTLDRKLHHSGIQSIPKSIDKTIQTTGEKPVFQSTQYTPQQLSEMEVESVLNSEEVLRFLEGLESRWNEELICGGIVDLLEDEFGFQIDDQELNTSEQKETILTELHSLTDLQFSKSRRIVHLEWSPHRQGILAAISVDCLSFEHRSGELGRPKDYALAEWDISNPMKPTRFLYSDQELTSFNYHPVRDPFIAAGTYTGQVAIWTESDDGSCTHSSSIEASHNAPITALRWIPGFEIDKNGTLISLESQQDCFEFITLSTDGKLMFWDLRLEKHLKKGKQVDFEVKKCMKPVFMIPFFGSEGGDLTLQNLCFPLSTSNPEIKVCTTDGNIILGDLSKAQGDSPEITEDLIQAHSGPVVCLERSPFFSDVYLTAGGWTFKLWREGHRVPVFISPMSPNLYTSGGWSPTRPGLIGLTTDAGTLEIWDLLEKSNQCSLSWNLGSVGLSSLVFSKGLEGKQGMQYLGVGDVQGTVHLLRVPRSLKRPIPDEKKLMAKLLHHQLSTLEQNHENSGNNTEQNQENVDPGEEKMKKIEVSNEEADYDQLEKEMRIQLGLGDEANKN